MAKRVIFFIIILVFMAASFYGGLVLVNTGLIPIFIEMSQLKYGFLIMISLVGLGAGVFIAPWIIRGFIKLVTFLEQHLQKMPTQDLIMGAAGLIIGLIIANLFAAILAKMGIPGTIVGVAVALFLCYLGISLGIKKREDILSFLGNLTRLNKERGGKFSGGATGYKILDTSVIIDGRIADLAESGFIEGALLIPVFILEELRHIADSSDTLRRNRGRRGLDILNKMQQNNALNIQIYDSLRGLENIAEVDSKLVKLAQRLGAVIVTNDYNLNKVAALHGVKVLNINELANAVKPVILPGEEMTVQVIRDGKEFGQGLAYLEDGTMIVVDGGKKYIGQTLQVLVTSVLQTSAGRMIFARPRRANTLEHPPYLEAGG
ncbi:MAG TPA: PIN domain nuclease [Desulfotomaculum sp.]|nr:PIN domain nuclease [Desulfotomaculum sp.]